MLSVFGTKKGGETNRAAFIPFIVSGHPTLEVSEKAVDALVEAGADALELGVPFSDALADGPVIQAASERTALQQDSILSTLEFATRIHKRHPQLPLILFGYFNPIVKMGIEKFAEKAVKSGVKASLVVDLPPEEADEYRRVLKAHDLKTVFLASPTTSSDRLKMISEASTGFLYYVSRVGVTGTQTQLSETLGDELVRVKKVLGNVDQRIAVGFGISTGKHAEEVARMADAVVVGSAFVKILSGNEDSETLIAALRSLAQEIATGVANAARLRS